MAYVDPGTFASAAILTAAEMNVIGDDIRYLKTAADQDTFAGVSLARTTNQSIATATYTPISWSSAPVMVNGTWWTSGTNITVPTGTVAAGFTYAVLECDLLIQYDINANYSRGAVVQLNGSTVEFGFFTSALPADNTVVSVTVWALAKDGDVLTGVARQASGGALNVTAARMKVKRLGYA